MFSRTFKLCNVSQSEYDAALLKVRKVSAVDLALRKVESGFYTQHRNLLLQFLETHCANYDGCEVRSAMNGLVVTLYLPRDLASQLDGSCGIELVLRDKDAVENKLYEIDEGAKVRMLHRKHAL